MLRGSAAVTRVGLRRARRPAERRQVDARQRAWSGARWRSSPTSRRPRGGRSAAWRPATDCAARARRPARRPAPARRADRAHAAPRRARAGRGRRRAVGASTASRASGPGDRFIAGALRGAGVPGGRSPSTRSTASTGRAPLQALDGGRRRSASAPRSSRSPRAPGAASPRCSSTSSALLPEGPFLFPPERALRPAARACCWPSWCASRCCGAPARRSRTPSRCRSTRSSERERRARPSCARSCGSRPSRRRAS